METTIKQRNDKDIKNNEVNKTTFQFQNIATTNYQSKNIIEATDVIDFNNYSKVYSFFKQDPIYASDTIFSQKKFLHERYREDKTFEDYTNFRKNLIKNEYEFKRHTQTSYSSQGVCQIGDVTLIASYDTGYDKKNNLPNHPNRDEKNNSIIDITDKDGRQKTLYLDNKAHVGGISYSNKYGKVYITKYHKDGDKLATINVYQAEDLANLDDNSKLNNEYYKEIKLPNNDKVSYLTIDGNNLLVGEFKEEGSSKLVEYELTNNGTDVTFKKEYKIPYEHIQGVCTKEIDGEKYYFFSSSWGRRNDSSIIITKLNNGNFEKVGQFKMPCLLEQISIDNNGNMMAVFESDCIEYGYSLFGSTSIVESVCHIDIDTIVRNKTSTKFFQA